MTDTLYELLARTCQDNGARIAIRETENPHRAVTYAELQSEVDHWANGLAKCGIGHGDTIAIWLPNTREWVVSFLAAAKLGAFVVPLNTRYKAEEIRHLLRVSSPKMLVMAPRFRSLDFQSTLNNAMTLGVEHDGTALPESLRWIVTVGTTPLRTTIGISDVTLIDWDKLRVSGAPDAGAGGPDDFAIAFGTSGTTSAPKLAVQTQGAVTRHVTAVARNTPFDRNDVYLAILPLCGTFGFVPALATLVAGGTVVLMPVFDPSQASATIEREKVTHLAGIESLIRNLLAHPTFTTPAIETVSRITVAGVSVDDLVEQAERKYGITVTNVYGSSEIFAFAAGSQIDADAEMRALPGGWIISDDLQARVVDPNTGAVLPDNTGGELQFSGRNVTTGYLGNDAATAKAFTADGWYRTGDHGISFGGGRGFRYQARIADTLRLKGTLVDPADIEAFLLSRDGVAFVQVVGVPGGDGDDRAVAFIITDAASDISEAQLLDECRSSLAGFKVPALIVLVDQYPTTPSANGDKVRKDVLRARAADLLAAPRTATAHAAS